MTTFNGDPKEEGIPWINLCGLLLKEAGFLPGETLEISIEENVILISKKQKLQQRL